MTITPAQIQSASQALRSVLRFDYPADSVLSRYFRDLPELGARDRAFVAEAVYGVLRRKRTLERLCGPEASTRHLVLAWLARIEGITLRQLGDGLHGLVQKVEAFNLAASGRHGLRSWRAASQRQLPGLADQVLAVAVVRLAVHQREAAPGVDGACGAQNAVGP